jgi:hypothetical protein
MRRVLLVAIIFSCCQCMPRGLPLRRLQQVEPDVVWPTAGAIARFAKMLYKEINAGDTKALRSKFAPEFRELCEMYGLDQVAAELFMSHEMRVNDLQITLHEMKKLGLLFQLLVEGESSSPVDGD